MTRFQAGALAALALSAAVAPAQAASFRAALDREAVAPGEPFVYQVTLTVANEEIANFRPPDFHGLQVVDAPRFPSRSTSMQIAGGQTSIENSFVWTYQLAVPAGAKGTVTIGAARASVGGHDMASNTVPVRVGTGGGGAARPSRPQPTPSNLFQHLFGGGPGGPGGPFGGGGDEDQPGAVASSSSAFIRVIPDKTRAFVGEQVTVGWYLYLTQNQNRYQNISEPHTDGFWSEDIPSTNPQGRLSFTEQVLNGRSYQVALLFKKALFPLAPGKLTITSMEAEVAQVDLFGSAVRARRLKTDPLVIEAIPLPHAGQPAGFDAANVGQYEISAAVDRAAVSVGDAVTLRIAVKGTGNVRNVRPPALPALDGWKTYEPKTDVTVDAGDVVSGTKTVEWLMRAERPGKTTVPPLVMETFDPAAKRYQAEKTAPIDILVTGEASAGPHPTAGTESPAPAVQGAPGAIRPIHARPALSGSAGLAFLRSGAFTATVVVPPLAWALALLFGRARARLSADEQRTRRRRLRSMARKRLRDAEAHRSAGRAAPFYAEIDRVLRDALGERLGTPVAGLQLGELRVLLSARGLGGRETADVVSALETCDEARFAPGASAGDPAALAAMESRAAELVAAIERAPLPPEAKA